MKYYTIRPTQKLADYVRYFWVFEGDASGSQPYIHHSFANVCPELIFHYRGPFSELNTDDSTNKTFVTGIHAQSRQYRRFVVKEKFGMFGIYLYPHALAALFGIPAIALTNEMPDLFSILKKADVHIEDRMFSAVDNWERFKIITSFLEEKVTGFKRPEVAYAVKSILDSKGQVGMKELCNEVFLSTRQFERNFKEHAGFTPKTFSRITRFYSTVEHLPNRMRSMTEIAYDHGYYDQSHFIAEFKEFSGFCPREWFGLRRYGFSTD